MLRRERFLLAVSLLVVMACVQSSGAQENFGVCGDKISELLSYGGAVTKVKSVRGDMVRLQSWFRHEFGEEGPFYHGLDISGLPPKEKPAAVKEARGWIAKAIKAGNSGKAWYLIVDRRVYGPHGMPALYVDPDNSARTTKWRPELWGDIEGECESLQGDAAIFLEDIPEGLRKQLPTD